MRKNNNYSAILCLIILSIFLCLTAVNIAERNTALNISSTQYEDSQAVSNASEHKVIYLTFDDGPSTVVTGRILDTLKEENVKATFFVVGEQAEKRPEMLKRIADEGHKIGVHTYTHNYKKIYSSTSALLDEIEKTKTLIYKITGIESDLFRFPGGSFNLSQNLIDAVKNKGYRYVDWNAACRDAEILSPTAYELYSSAINTAAQRSTVVMLCHDDASRKTTATALPSIIHYFKAQGYTFATF